MLKGPEDPFASLQAAFGGYMLFCAPTHILAVLPVLRFTGHLRMS